MVMDPYNVTKTILSRWKVRNGNLTGMRQDENCKSVESQATGLYILNMWLSTI